MDNEKYYQIYNKTTVEYFNQNVVIFTRNIENKKKQVNL